MRAAGPKRKIGQLCELINGRAFKPEDWGTAGLPIVRIQNLNDLRKPFNYFAGSYVEKHLVGTGDVLLSWSGTPGTSFGCFIWERGAAILNQHIFNVKVKRDLVLPEFFVHSMNSKLGEMIELAHGAAGLRHITKAKLEHIELPIPSIEEQRRIVIRIKECMDRVDEMQSLRDSSLKDQFHLSASVIESELHPSFAEEARWQHLPIDRLVITTRNGRSISQDVAGRANGSVLTLTAVRDVTLNTEFKKPIELADAVAAQFRIEQGDVFVSRANTIDLVGLSAVAECCPQERLIYPDLLIKLTADQTKVLPRYLAYALRSAGARRQIKDRALGSSQTMVKISGERLREVSIPVPSITEQLQIVARLDAGHELINQLKKESSEIEAPTIRASILRNAFAEDW